MSALQNQQPRLTGRTPIRIYHNRLKVLKDAKALLNDHPQFVHPIEEVRRYKALLLVNDEEAYLSVRAWQFSYNAREIIKMPNCLRSNKTAVIMVHPWGIDDGQGWKNPETARACDLFARRQRTIWRQNIHGKLLNRF